MMKLPRLIPPIWFFLALGLVAALHRYWPLASVVPAPWQYAGVPVVILGATLGGWSARLFRRAGTTLDPSRESSALVSWGPYRFTRNPMYLSFVFVLLGACIFAGSLSPFLVIPLFVALIQRLFIRAEEAMLLRAFPAEYAAYSTRVRRWL